jgi:GT2 family glycosyltransferase
MVSDKPHVSIIILNWNGWKDTVECLESVLKLNYPKFNIILIDNHSTNDSMIQIQNWARGQCDTPIQSNYPDLITPIERKPVKLISTDGDNPDEIKNTDIENKAILFVRNTENFGFAVATNQGMDIAHDLFESDYYYLLNNDTVIEKNALTDLVNILSGDKSISIAQSTLYSYQQGKIVNAGGRILFWGQTRYYKNIKKNEVRKVSSVSGCALFVRAITINNFGKLSDRFFHGEEDFEFSLRMKENQQVMVCSEGSRVYHKIGMSVKKMMHDYERRTFLFALNRIVDLKDYYPKFVWYIWRLLALFYFGYLLQIQYKVPVKRTLILIGKIYHYSGRLSDVKRTTLEKVYSEMKFW